METPRAAGAGRERLDADARIVRHAVAEEHHPVDARRVVVAHHLEHAEAQALGHRGGPLRADREEAAAGLGAAVAVERGGGEEDGGAGVEGDDGEAVAVAEAVEQGDAGGAGVVDGAALHRARGVDHEGEVDGRAAQRGGLGDADADAGHDVAPLGRGDEAVGQGGVEGEEGGSAGAPLGARAGGGGGGEGEGEEGVASVHGGRRNERPTDGLTPPAMTSSSRR